MTLIVSPLSHVERLIAERRPSHLVSLLDPDWMIDTPAGIAPGRHLKIAVHDIHLAFPGMTAPDAALVDALVEFGAGWDGAAPMLIHCHAGISRSTASAFVLACARNPRADEALIARRLRAAAPNAFPNRLIVALADRRLGRGGRMVAAVEAMGQADFGVEGEPFELAARHPVKGVR
jgi:predicted protein tyrosine phosphatase